MENINNTDYIQQLNVYDIYSMFNKVYYEDKHFKSPIEKFNALKKVYDKFIEYRNNQKKLGFINNYNASQEICKKLVRKMEIVQKEINTDMNYNHEILLPE
jgi:hypothetical protein